jgi:nitrogen fixation NifU-like protein
MSNLYAEDILYWARDQRFRGTLEHPDASAHRENPSCGDALRCTVQIVGGKLEKIRFEGVGCVICLASATVLAEHAEGLTVDVALALEKQNMMEWLACDVGPMRTNCMMLALLTLHDALCSRF